MFRGWSSESWRSMHTAAVAAGSAGVAEAIVVGAVKRLSDGPLGFPHDVDAAKGGSHT